MDRAAESESESESVRVGCFPESESELIKLTDSDQLRASSYSRFTAITKISDSMLTGWMAGTEPSSELLSTEGMGIGGNPDPDSSCPRCLECSAGYGHGIHPCRHWPFSHPRRPRRADSSAAPPCVSKLSIVELGRRVSIYTRDWW